jgi:hypothetical protein
MSAYGPAVIVVRVLVVATLALSVSPAPVAAQALRRPVACDGCITYWYYFDDDPSSGLEDWSCGSRSYDTHRGTDYSLSGGLAAIDTGYDVVAAADGMVIEAQDGFFDRCTMCGGSGCGYDFAYGCANHVTIAHDGYTSWYCHMRNGSVRVAVGDRVTCGQAIGQIGSSGCSSGAHLHFEVRPAGASYLDAYNPYAGECSETSPTHWVDQGAYLGMPGPSCAGAPAVCPAGSSALWTCSADRTERTRCIDGSTMVEACAGGCTTTPAGEDDVCAAVANDADRDGSSIDVDCDDGDPSIHPGAVEVCGDGVDQDCAGGDASCADGGASAATDAGIAAGDDGGAPPRDGGATTRPDGAAGGDAAPQRVDGAPGPVGADESSPVIVGGCGCRAGARGAGAWSSGVLGAIAAAAASARRRRRVSRR